MAQKFDDGEGGVDAAAYEEFRGLFFDMALICEIDKGLDGFGNPVRRRDLDDARWVHAGTRGWLEGQHERTSSDLGV